MPNNSVHIAPHGDGRWHVYLDDRDTISSLHDDRIGAEVEGRRLARRLGTTLFVRGTDGRVLAEESLG